MSFFHILEDMKTLSQILSASNAFLEKVTDIPTGNTLEIRSSFANQAVWRASALAQFPELHEVYVVSTSTFASFPLPSNFRELMASPMVLRSNGEWEEYEVIRPLERYKKSASDKYCYILGNPASGYTAVFNNLIANATLSFDYQRYPTGLLTLTDICELSDPTYVVAQLNADMLLSFNDERYNVYQAEAKEALSNMIGKQMKSPSGGAGRAKRLGAANYIIE
jgi:hypothetical protein